VYDLETREIFVSRDVVFCEPIFPFKMDPSSNGLEVRQGNSVGPTTTFIDEFGPATTIAPLETQQEKLHINGSPEPHSPSKPINKPAARGSALGQDGYNSLTIPAAAPSLPLMSRGLT